MSEPTREELQAQMAAMQKQMEELQRQLNTTQTGSGAIAQGGGTAAGAGGVAVGGDVHGNVYAGKPVDDPAQAIAIYRRVYAAGCQNLPLRGVDVGVSDAQGNRRQMALEQVYVALDTTTRVQVEKGRRARKDPQFAATEREETRAVTALEAVIHNPQLVLLGDPGSGKTTFLNHLGLCLALHAQRPDAGWLQRLPAWPAAQSNLTPILVVLRDFARSLPARKDKPSPIWLWAFIEKRLAAQNLAFAAEPLHALLEEGKAIVLLDGLDELPTEQQRALVRDAVQAFAARYADSRFVATCRTLSYQDPKGQIGEWPAYTLAEFDEAKIDGFIDAWYGELARLIVVTAEEAARMTRRLRDATRRPDLRELARNPLLLTVMALVHAHKGRLPDARALLYEETVDILLLRWEQIKAGGDEEALPLRRLLQEAGRTDLDLKKLLWRLAYEAQEGGSAGDGSGLADIGELRLLRGLAALHPDKSLAWAHDMMEVIRLRAGLLVERAPEIYTFPHRTFQEFLAGAHLAAQGDFALRAVGLVDDSLYWRQVILLGAGRLVYLSGDTDKPLALVGELCPETRDVSDLGWRRAWLAGEVLLEAGLNRVQDSTLGKDLLTRVRRRLVDLLRAGALQPVERAAAGDVLGLLGDPRFRADAWYLPDEPLLGFVEIPAGSFVMGSDPQRDGGAHSEEQSQHSLTLPAYYIARYPVTVAQFQAFVDATGYTPEGEVTLRDPPTRPLHRVAWYEALGYCEWLTQTLPAWPHTPEPLATLLRAGKEGSGPWRFTLPSESEWEKAARGDDGRIYPWGGVITPHHANCRETGIGTTSAVGCFPQGASPYGVEEMSGNVWEWTRSLWGKDVYKPDYRYPYNPDDGREQLDTDRRVLYVARGGSFFNNLQDVRCACRGRNFAGSWTELGGFRLVLSPVIPLDSDRSGR